MTIELNDTQKAGLERLGKKQQKKTYWYDSKLRSAYEYGRLDGFLIGIAFVSIVLWTVVGVVGIAR